MKPIILNGGGGHCISCIDVIERSGNFELIGILDLIQNVGQNFLNYPLIGTENDLNVLIKECSNFLITLGQIKSSIKREIIYLKVKEAGGNLPVIISPFAYVSKHTTIGEGTIIMHNAVVNAGTSIGNCCIINTKSLIEHEATVGNFCHISTASIVNGQANIGDCSFIGSNTVISNNIHVAANTVIAAGSQVLKNIDLPGTYFGSPLRKIR